MILKLFLNEIDTTTQNDEIKTLQDKVVTLEKKIEKIKEVK